MLEHVLQRPFHRLYPEANAEVLCSKNEDPNQRERERDSAISPRALKGMERHWIWISQFLFWKRLKIKFQKNIWGQRRVHSRDTDPECLQHEACSCYSVTFVLLLKSLQG